MMITGKKGQYSFEILIFLILFMFFYILFSIFFSGEKAAINQISQSTLAQSEAQKVAHCLEVVEILGRGSTCSYALIDDLDNRNYSVSVSQNSNVLQISSVYLNTIQTSLGVLNQSYLNISHTGFTSNINGEVEIHE